jgi:hypothetical protein
MNSALGPLVIERVSDAAGDHVSYRIAWTAAQLRRIAQALESGDQDFLTTMEVAMRQALDTVLTPQRG